MVQHGRPAEQVSPPPRRRVAAIAATLLLLAGCMAAWTQRPRGTLIEVINETGAPLDRVLISGKFGILADLGRIEAGARAAARISPFDTRELLVTHQQPGQERVLDYRFGWYLVDDILMRPHIRVGLWGNSAMNTIQRRRIYARPLD